MANTKSKRSTTGKTSSTARKSTAPKRKAGPAGKSSKAKASARSAAAAPEKNGNFLIEILLVLVFGAAILMMVSNIGKGGPIGNVISTYLFGTMGKMAFAFPFILILVTLFAVINKNSKRLKKKIFAILFLFFIICGFLQIGWEGYKESTTLLEYFYRSAAFRDGGGILGGMVCISTVSAFGRIGSYVILIAFTVICLIWITQKSLIVFIDRMYMRCRKWLKGGQRYYQDSSEERALKRELKSKKREQDRQSRIEEIEREMAELDAMPEEEEFHVPVLPSKKNAPKVKREKAPEPQMPEEGEQLELNFDEEEEPEAPAKPKVKKKNSVAGLGGMLKKPKRPRHEEADADEEESDEIAEIRAMRAQLHERNQGIASELKSKQRFSSPKEERGASPFRIQRAKVEATFDEEDFEDDYDNADMFMPEEEEAGIPERRSPQKNPRSSKAEQETGIQNIENEIQEKEAAPPKVYHYPPLKILKRGNGKTQGDSDEHLRETAQKLEDTLRNFGVNVTVTNVSCGPTVTQYEIQPEMGVKVSRIVSLADDIKLNLATPDIRIEAPIPGKAAIGIEVPNKENSPVMLRDLIQSETFQNASSKLSFAVGKDIAGKTVVADIAKMPHLLIAGSTGSGKSVCINTLITSILYKASPEEVKMIMIDPKVVELSVYNGIPHLLIPVVTDPKKAAGALNWAVQEMTNRYNTFAEFNVRKLEEYNNKIMHMDYPEGERPAKMPQIIVIVDELADLMMVAPGEVEDAIVRLTQLARAAGIHLVIATQRPSVNVITGLIKANMPSRIAFAVSSGVDSRVILDNNGAEKLLGKGDMLFYPQGYPKPARLQGAFISDEEVSEVVDFLSKKNDAVEYNTNIQAQVNTAVSIGGSSAGGEERDVYFEEAGRLIIEKDKASIGMLQRMFKIGFNRAARIMDQLADAGVVGPEEGTKPRKILMTESEFDTYLEEH